MDLVLAGILVLGCVSIFVVWDMTQRCDGTVGQTVKISSRTYTFSHPVFELLVHSGW